MRKHIWLFHHDLALYRQMATLAKCRDIPPSAVFRVDVQMMYRQSVPILRIMQLSATHTTPIRGVFYRLRYLRPVIGIVAAHRTFTFHLTSRSISLNVGRFGCLAFRRLYSCSISASCSILRSSWRAVSRHLSHRCVLLMPIT